MCIGKSDYYQCQKCEAIFLSPTQLPSREMELAEYRLHQNDVHDPAYRKFLSRLAVPLLARLPASQSGLDYGCGPGPALAAMMTEAGHAMAIYDPLFFDNREVLQKRYNFITCTEVAEHFHYPHQEFETLTKMLKPGGWLAMMTLFAPDDANFANWHYHHDPTHVVFYREKTFKVLADIFHWECELPCANVVVFKKM